MADDSKPPVGSAASADVPMTVWEHLAELRKRLVWSILFILPCMGIAWAWKEELLDYLVAPLATAWVKLGLGKPTLHFSNPVDMFVAYMQISGVVGFMIASPFVFYQIWGFIAPGLYDREKAYAVPFSLASALFFVGGAFFGYSVVFPLGFESLLGLAGMLPSHVVNVQPTIMIDQYLTFATRMLLAFGVVFEVPVVVSFLSLAGLVNWKQLLSFGRFWILIASVIAALLTPPDVGSMMMMLAPLIALYYLSVIVAYFLGPKVEPEGDESESI